MNYDGKVSDSLREAGGLDTWISILYSQFPLHDLYIDIHFVSQVLITPF